MAKESEELLTPEVTKPRTVGARRFSTGKTSSENSDEKIVPHYLRASTGSCHDFCKYGRKHAFEAKERRSIPDRATRKQLHQSSEQSIGGITTSVARLRGSVDSMPRKKMSSVKLRESIDSEHQNSDTSDTSKHGRQTKSFDCGKQIGIEDLTNRKTTSLVKVKPSLLLKSRTSPPMRQGILSTSKNMESPSKSTSTKVETPSKSTSKEVKTLSKLASNNVDTLSRSKSKVKTLSKSTSKMVETSSMSSSLKGKEMKLPAKRVTSLNSNSAGRKTISSMNSSKGFGGQRNSEIKMEKGAASSRAASRTSVAPLKVSLSPKPSLIRVASLNSRKHKSVKSVSHLKNQRIARKVEPEEYNNNVVAEKTLYVIKMESGNETLQSDQNASYDDESYLSQSSSPKFSPPSTSQSISQEDQEESEYTSGEFEEDSLSGNDELEYMKNVDTLEAEKKGKLRKDGIVCSEDKDCQTLKLKFRRGKVVENQIERNSPRRLKFRRAKLMGEKANLKAVQRKSFKERDEACADSTDAGPEKVVLRHQDMKDKKDAQGLFNNVIEETASKLVETRKSKVKALVGAFETVISLQEKKPSVNTIN